MTAQLVFDRVVITEGSARQELPADGFLALPLYLRVRYVLDRAVEFFMGTQRIERGAALAALRKLSQEQGG